MPWPLILEMLAMSDGMDAAKRSHGMEASMAPYMKPGKQKKTFGKLERKYDSVAPVKETTLEEVDMFARSLFRRK